MELRQDAIAEFTLDGEFKSLVGEEGSAEAAVQLVRAWRDRCGELFETFRERYAQMRVLGARSMPAGEPTAPSAQPEQHAKRSLPVVAPPAGSENALPRSGRTLPVFVPPAGGEKAVERSERQPGPAPPIGARVGRNDPCPCGSGRKYKHCCGRR